MTIKPIFKAFAALLVSAMMFGANAASLSFDANTYIAIPGEHISVTVNFDFIDTPAYGGGFNVIYNSTILEFVSYTQAAFSGPGTPQEVASSLGVLVGAGQYLGAA